MDKPLHVLIVEDSEDDTLLILRELEQGGYAPISERVETPEAMGAALEKRTWDIIIADHRMPHFSAPEALKLLQQSGLDLPFIIVSGTIGEDVAVEAMKSGAHDYIMKTNLKRLVPAIERELRDAEVRRQRQQAEDEIRRSRDYLEKLTNSMWDMVFSVKMPERVIEWANDSFRIIGYEPEECIGKTTEFLYPDEKGFFTFGNKLKSALAGGKNVLHAEQLLKRKNGEVFPAEITATFFKEKGEVVRVTSIVRDVTERKQAEEALRQSEEKLRLMFESVTEGITVSDLDGNIVQLNEAVVRMHGYDSKEELIGRSAFELIAEKDHARAMENMKRTLEDGYIKNIEYTLLTKDGSEFPAELSAALMRDTSGNAVALVAITRDITERKQAEEKARELQVLREVDNLRSQLLSHVSHELRTPLASIKGFASTLLQPDIKWSEDEQLDFIQSIDQEADRLTRLISDLLDMSRLEAGAMKLEKRNYQISEILDSVGDSLASLSEHHQLQVIVPSGLSPVFVDEMRIGQVLTNLVENAAKFSKEDSQITVEAQADGDQLIISVTDRGQGIPPELLDRVFDRFYQAESIVTGRKSGTGLGLSICRGIIQAHGGKIWVESKVGEGSKFSFSLPVSKGGKEVA